MTTSLLFIKPPTEINLAGFSQLRRGQRIIFKQICASQSHHGAQMHEGPPKGSPVAVTCSTLHL
jgi:hypothetical protein